RVLPAAPTCSSHSRIWPRRNSERGSARSSALASFGLMSGAYYRRLDWRRPDRRQSSLLRYVVCCEAVFLSTGPLSLRPPPVQDLLPRQRRHLVQRVDRPRPLIPDLGKHARVPQAAVRGARILQELVHDGADVTPVHLAAVGLHADGVRPVPKRPEVGQECL